MVQNNNDRPPVYEEEEPALRDLWLERHPVLQQLRKELEALKIQRNTFEDVNAASFVNTFRRLNNEILEKENQLEEKKTEFSQQFAQAVTPTYDVRHKLLEPKGGGGVKLTGY